MAEKVLDVVDLETHFISDGKIVKAVDGVSFHLYKGETLGIVGESGSGKSVTSLSVMQLLRNTPGKIVGGTIQFGTLDIAHASDKQMRKIRGNQISMIFQEPMTSLNPVYKIGRQLTEGIILHKNVSKKEATQRAQQMLEKVGIPRAKQILNECPHQLSGGMRQRVMIAMAMACDPEILIADEPTTALDVTIQAQILELMNELRETSQTSILMITHDLGVVAEMCDRVVVMYAGQIVEEAPIGALFAQPKHPYTQGLLASIPKLGEEVEELTSISGTVPTPETMPSGCRFEPRCPYAMARCKEQNPVLKADEDGRVYRCWLQEEGSHE